MGDKGWKEEVGSSGRENAKDEQMREERASEVTSLSLSHTHTHTHTCITMPKRGCDEPFAIALLTTSSVKRSDTFTNSASMRVYRGSLASRCPAELSRGRDRELERSSGPAASGSEHVRLKYVSASYSLAPAAQEAFVGHAAVDCALGSSPVRSTTSGAAIVTFVKRCALYISSLSCGSRYPAIARAPKICSKNCGDVRNPASSASLPFVPIGADLVPGAIGTVRVAAPFGLQNISALLSVHPLSLQLLAPHVAVGQAYASSAYVHAAPPLCGTLPKPLKMASH